MTAVDTSTSELEAFKESLYPPAWLASHPALIARDIRLSHALKPRYVYTTHPYRFVVKIIEPPSEEILIYEKLLRSGPAPPNHILPCTIIKQDTDRHPFIIMPSLTDLSTSSIWKWDLPMFVRGFRQMVEAVQLLHSLNIAHMDVAMNNFLMATQYDIPLHDCVELGYIYIIDFGASRQFELGPGHQPAVELPSTQAPKPRDIKRLDPYSWDMYFLGFLFQMVLRSVYNSRKQPQPWILRRYAEWLVSDERGCSTICHCRPSARGALLVITLIERIIDAV